MEKLRLIRNEYMKMIFSHPCAFRRERKKPQKPTVNQIFPDFHPPPKKSFPPFVQILLSYSFACYS